ncbi:MAG: type II toxin-antitoxin system MqsR family toxin [Ignavibacteria bacterium]|nr:type II toxin-antitoxin system MqsR family toxin [Ignavibacteria bacterium]
MISSDKIQNYLNELRVLIQVYDIYFVPRDEVTKGIMDLGLTFLIAKEIILGLEIIDYVDGPMQDHSQNNFYIWIFGKVSPLTSSDEIYIKISERRESKKPVCLSFHKARKTLSYPFKKTNSNNNNPLRI